MISSIKKNLLESQNDYYFNNRELYNSYIASHFTMKDFNHKYQKINFTNNIVNGLEKAYMEDQIFTYDEQYNIINTFLRSELFSLQQKHKLYVLINGKRYSHMTLMTQKIDYHYKIPCGTYETVKFVLDNTKNNKDSLGVTLQNAHLLMILNDEANHDSLNEILSIFLLNGYEINDRTLFMILCHCDAKLVSIIKQIITMVLSFDKKYITCESIMLLFSSLSYHVNDNCIHTRKRPGNYLYIDYIFDILHHIIDSGVSVTFDMLRYAKTNFTFVESRWDKGNDIFFKNIDTYNKKISQIVTIGEKIIKNNFDTPDDNALRHACMSNCPEYLEFCLKHAKCDCTTEHLKLACKTTSTRLIRMLLDAKIEPDEECVTLLIKQHVTDRTLKNDRISTCVGYLTSNGVPLTQTILESCIKYGMEFPKGTYHDIALDDSAYELFHNVNITKINNKKYPLTINKETLKLREECKKSNLSKILNSLDKLDRYCYDNILLNESDIAVEIIDNAIKNKKYKPNIDSILRIQDIRLRKKRYVKYIDLVNS